MSLPKVLVRGVKDKGLFPVPAEVMGLYQRSLRKVSTLTSRSTSTLMSFCISV